MATCAVTSNLLISCADDDANAGLQSAYLVFMEQIDSVTLGALTKDNVTAITTLGAAKFVELQGRFERSALTSEMTRENYGKRVERTLTMFVPYMEGTKAQILNNLSSGGKLFVVAASNNINASSGNRIAYVFGWDKKLAKTGGAMLTVGEQIDQETGGNAGYNLTFTAIGTELIRDLDGDIVVEDGATGTTVSFGA